MSAFSILPFPTPSEIRASWLGESPQVPQNPLIVELNRSSGYEPVFDKVALGAVYLIEAVASTLIAEFVVGFLAASTLMLPVLPFAIPVALLAMFGLCHGLWNCGATVIDIARFVMQEGEIVSLGEAFYSIVESLREKPVDELQGILNSDLELDVDNLPMNEWAQLHSDDNPYQAMVPLMAKYIVDQDVLSVLQAEYDYDENPEIERVLLLKKIAMAELLLVLHHPLWLGSRRDIARTNEENLNRVLSNYKVRDLSLDFSESRMSNEVLINATPHDIYQQLEANFNDSESR